jgi:PII-like signaling protein
MHEHGNEGWGENQHLPIQIEFVESKAKVESLLPKLFAMLSDGMIEAQETTILKIARQDDRSGEGRSTTE